MVGGISVCVDHYGDDFDKSPVNNCFPLRTICRQPI